MSALAIFVATGFVAAAVDYGRANSLKTAMQVTVDTTALMLSKNAQTMTDTQLAQQASAYFTGLFQRSDAGDAKNLQVTAQLSSPQPGTFVLRVSASATVDSMMARILGQSQMAISASTDVTWGIKKIELALVLDNTGSMAQHGKLAALKTAAHNLLSKLQEAAVKPGDVKVAIIPFDTTVNIGTGFADEFWVDYSVNNIKKSKWHGCVMDRDQSNDVQDTTPITTDSHTWYPAATCGSLAKAQPLTTDWTLLNNQIDAMTAAGNTNITIGLAWGWHALTSDLPLTEAAAPTPDLDKIIILLTDGDNTQNRWSTTASKIDPRTSALCSNIKATGIKIYTVRVIDGNQALLQSCATTPSMYYEVDQASQLDDVFSSIAQSLARLRIAK